MLLQVLTVQAQDFFGYHGLTREPTDRIFNYNEETGYDQDIQQIIDKAWETIHEERFNFKQSDLTENINIHESNVFHVKEQDGNKVYMPKYVRNAYGYPVVSLKKERRKT